MNWGVFMARNPRGKRSRRLSLFERILSVNTSTVVCIALILFLIFLIAFSATKLFFVNNSKNSVEYDVQKVEVLADEKKDVVSVQDESDSEALYTSPELLEEKEEDFSALDGARSFTLCAIGDVMCHNTQYMDAYDKSTSEYDFSYVFSDISKYTMSPDITVGSLETSFAGSDVGYSNYPRFNSPDNLAYCLRRIGVDVLSTAGNHCLDMGFSGLSIIYHIWELIKLKKIVRKFCTNM